MVLSERILDHRVPGGWIARMAGPAAEAAVAGMSPEGAGAGVGKLVIGLKRKARIAGAVKGNVGRSPHRSEGA